MNIKDLNKFSIDDLKNIDINQIKEGFQSRPDILINVVLIGLTIFATITIYSGNKSEAKKLRGEKVKLIEKFDVMKQLEIIKKEHAEFVESFPESLLREQIIDQLSKFASHNNVQIISFSPVNIKNDEFKERTLIEIVVSIAEYESIIGLIKDIENAPYSITVKEWSGNLDQRNKMKMQDGTDFIPLEARIKIEGVKLNE